MSDFYLVKTDANGNLMWNKTYGGTADDFGRSVVQTSDGGYAIVGTMTSAATSYDVWLVKTDANGNMQWNKTYGGTDLDNGDSVVQANDGGYVIAGDTSSVLSLPDAYLIRTDASGNMLWNKTYGGASSDYGNDVTRTIDGGYAISGNTWSFGAGWYDMWLIKTDSNGNALWNKTYGGPDLETGNSVIQTSDGGYAIGGITASAGQGGNDAFLVKTDSNGNMQWNNTYGGPKNDYGYSLIQTSDEGYAIVGMTCDYTVLYQDMWLIKTSANGNMQWTKTYGGINYDVGMSIIQTGDGGYIVAGNKGADAWLIKVAVEGESGLVQTDSTSNSITLYRGANDVYWNYVRIRIWKID